MTKHYTQAVPIELAHKLYDAGLPEIHLPSPTKNKELDTTNIGVHRWCEIKLPKRGFFSRILHLKRKIKK